MYTKSSSSKLAVDVDTMLNLTALKSSEVLSFFGKFMMACINKISIFGSQDIKSGHEMLIISCTYNPL